MLYWHFTGIYRAGRNLVRIVDKIFKILFLLFISLCFFAFAFSSLAIHFPIFFSFFPFFHFSISLHVWGFGSFFFLPFFSPLSSKSSHPFRPITLSYPIGTLPYVPYLLPISTPTIKPHRTRGEKENFFNLRGTT